MTNLKEIEETFRIHNELSPSQIKHLINRVKDLEKELENVAYKECPGCGMATLNDAGSEQMYRQYKRAEKYKEALGSISRNSCCDQCQEAKFVALKALEDE